MKFGATATVSHDSVFQDGTPTRFGTTATVSHDSVFQDGTPLISYRYYSPRYGTLKIHVSHFKMADMNFQFLIYRRII